MRYNWAFIKRELLPAIGGKEHAFMDTIKRFGVSLFFIILNNYFSLPFGDERISALFAIGGYFLGAAIFFHTPPGQLGVYCATVIFLVSTLLYYFFWSNFDAPSQFVLGVELLLLFATWAGLAYLINAVIFSRPDDQSPSGHQ